jgi:hypothetical protein
MLQRIGTELKPALAYLRRGSAIAERNAIYAFAARAGFEIVTEFKDAANAIAAAPDEAALQASLIALLTRINLNSVKAVIVGTANLFADAAIYRVVGYERLREKGVDLIAADAPEAFAQEAMTHEIVKQVLGATTQFDVAAATAAAASRARARKVKTGKPHRKTYAELAPEATLMAKRLYQAGQTNNERITLREISAKLASVGYLQPNRKPFHPEVIRRMLKGNWPRNRAPK